MSSTDVPVSPIRSLPPLEEQKSPSPPAQQQQQAPPRVSVDPARPSIARVRKSEQFDRRYDGPFAQETRRPSTVSTFNNVGLAGPASPGIAALSPNRSRLSETAGNGEIQVDAYSPTPPSLNYSLRTRKWAIFLFWTVIVFDSVAMPLALYFGLWYGVGPGAANPENRKLSPNTVFSIVTAALGGASILEYFVRFWRLWKKGSTCRVIDAHRWYLDWFHWNFSLAWIIVMIELIVGSVPEHPYIRLLSMPLVTMLFVFGTQLLIIDALRYFEVPAPVRISSVPKNAQLRPGIYSLIEDVCAVDGSGGTEFREALTRRYMASHVFRVMLRRLGEFWAVGAEGCAILCTILIFTLDSGDAAFSIGWSVPFVWAGIWAWLTILYVQRELKKEADLWAIEARKGGG